METKTLIENAKSRAFPDLSQRIFFLLIETLIILFLVTFGFVVWQLLINKYNIAEALTERIDMPTSGYVVLIFIALCVAFAHMRMTLYRPSFIKKGQAEYLQELYDAKDEEIGGWGNSLMLLRAVPEIGESTPTEQEHIDIIKEKIAELKAIEAAFDELGLERN